MTVRLVTFVAAGLALALGALVELRHRRKQAAPDSDNDFDMDMDEGDRRIEENGDEDKVADIIRRARPALERATEIDKPAQAPE